MTGHTSDDATSHWRGSTDAGFTLVEMVVTVAVVLVCVAAALLAAPGILQQGRRAKCDSTAESIGNAITASYAQHGDYTWADRLVEDGYLVAEPDASSFVIGTPSPQGGTVTFGADCSGAFTPAIWAAFASAGSYGFGESQIAPADAPGAPQSLAAVAVDGAVELAWHAPADDGGSPVTAYSVQFATWTQPFGPLGSYQAASGCESVTVGASTSCIVTGLTPGSFYYFRVAAVNDVGSGPYTTTVSSHKVLAAPDVPFDLNTTPGDTTVTLTWAVPAPNDGSKAAITGYTVQVSEDEDSDFAAADGCTSLGFVFTCTATNLTNGTPYYFRIAADSAVGSSAFTTPVSATPA